MKIEITVDIDDELLAEARKRLEIQDESELAEAGLKALIKRESNEHTRQLDNPRLINPLREALKKRK